MVEEAVARFFSLRWEIDCNENGIKKPFENSSLPDCYLFFTKGLFCWDKLDKLFKRIVWRIKKSITTAKTFVKMKLTNSNALRDFRI